MQLTNDRNELVHDRTSAGIGAGALRSVASIGDLNNDGILDIAVGIPPGGEHGLESGAVVICMLRPNGSILAHETIASPRTRSSTYPAASILVE